MCHAHEYRDPCSLLTTNCRVSGTLLLTETKQKLRPGFIGKRSQRKILFPPPPDSLETPEKIEITRHQNTETPFFYHSFGYQAQGDTSTWRRVHLSQFDKKRVRTKSGRSRKPVIVHSSRPSHLPLPRRRHTSSTGERRRHIDPNRYPLRLPVN